MSSLYLGLTTKIYLLLMPAVLSLDDKTVITSRYLTAHTDNAVLTRSCCRSAAVKLSCALVKKKAGSDAVREAESISMMRMKDVMDRNALSSVSRSKLGRWAGADSEVDISRAALRLRQHTFSKRLREVTPFIDAVSECNRGISSSNRFLITATNIQISKKPLKHVLSVPMNTRKNIMSYLFYSFRSLFT